MIITITGSLGSGKSTISKLLSEKLGLKRYSTGEALREVAVKRGMSPLELNKLAQSDKSIDDEIDSVLKSLKDSVEDLVIDSRLAWHFIPKSIKVKLDIDEETAALRIMKDNRSDEAYQNKAEAIEKIKARRLTEVERFKRYYNADIEDNSNFDLVINSKNKKPEEICTEIITYIQTKEIELPLLAL